MLDDRFIQSIKSLHEKMLEVARQEKINVKKMDFMEYDGDESYDFITMFEFIEHTLDPRTILEKVAQIIKPGGYVLLTTPNIGSLFFKIMEKKWPALHQYCHNYYYTAATMTKLVEKTGFEVVYLKKRILLWTSIYQLRKRFVELFPWLGAVFNLFSFLDARAIPFFSGGSIEFILQKR